MAIELRFGVDFIDAAIRRHLHPGGRLVVLVDQDYKSPEWLEVIDARVHSPAILDRPVPRAAIYAVDQDDIGLPFVQRLVKLNVKFYPVLTGVPAQWSHKDRVAREVIEAEFKHQTEAGFAKFDFGFGDAENICQALHMTRTLPGAYVEVGCYQGSSSRVALRYMKQSGIQRPSCFIDVFQGFTFPEARKSIDAIWVNSHETDGIEAVSARLREIDPAAVTIKGNIITDDLPAEFADIAVANLDVDQIDAVHAGLVKLAPRKSFREVS